MFARWPIPLQEAGPAPYHSKECGRGSAPSSAAGCLQQRMCHCPNGCVSKQPPRHRLPLHGETCRALVRGMRTSQSIPESAPAGPIGGPSSGSAAGPRAGHQHRGRSRSARQARGAGRTPAAAAAASAVVAGQRRPGCGCRLLRRVDLAARRQSLISCSHVWSRASGVRMREGVADPASAASMTRLRTIQCSRSRGAAHAA